MSALIVNLFGAPGAGKSTGAAILYAALKTAGINAELVTEFAKDKTWEQNKSTLAAQDYIFAKQHFRIRRVVDQVDVIVTDSPLLLSSFYAGHEPTLGRPFHKLVRYVFRHYDNLNFFICRSKPYNPAGRNQSEAESDRIALRMMNFLQLNQVPYLMVPGTPEGYQQISRVICNQLTERGLLKEEEEKPNEKTFDRRRHAK